MTDETVHRWGILRHRPLFMSQIEDHLPTGHKIIATRTVDGQHEHLIEGEDMPSVAAEQEPQRVEILFCTDEPTGAAYCYWAHRPRQRWLLPPGLWPCATD